MCRPAHHQLKGALLGQLLLIQPGVEELGVGNAALRHRGTGVPAAGQGQGGAAAL